jgi:hypothetical protein
LAKRLIILNSLLIKGMLLVNGSMENVCAMVAVFLLIIVKRLIIFNFLLIKGILMVNGYMENVCAMVAVFPLIFVKRLIILNFLLIKGMLMVNGFMRNVFAMGEAFRLIVLRQFIISDGPLIKIPRRATSDMPMLQSAICHFLKSNEHGSPNGWIAVEWLAHNRMLFCGSCDAGLRDGYEFSRQLLPEWAACSA